MYYNTNHPCGGIHGPKNYFIIETHEGCKFMNLIISKQFINSFINIRTIHGLIINVRAIHGPIKFFILYIHFFF